MFDATGGSNHGVNKQEKSQPHIRGGAFVVLL